MSSNFLGTCSCLTLGAAAWAPYFDDIDAIIYLAPVSGFDEVRKLFLCGVGVILSLFRCY